MITHRYYITTIIAILLFLSLGILIGGTLGQQWINEKQQSLISHFENKTDELVKTNKTLEKENEELVLSYQQLKDDYQILFGKSIATILDGKQILWLNHNEENEFESLKGTIKNAGAILFEADLEKDNQYLNYDYDAILLVIKSKEDFQLGNEIALSKVPVILVHSEDKGKIEKLDNDNDIYVQNINEEALNDHYQFIHFLNKLLEEQKHE